MYFKIWFDYKNELDGNLTPGTVKDTGSTGRLTNEIGDGDFDFLFKLDNNILLKKDILNRIKEYSPESGLCGVGVENWILQNVESFIDVASNFLEIAKNHSFEEFKQLYTVWDFGKIIYQKGKENMLTITL